ncbi:putative Ester hydrolase C11-like protein [Cardiosporidium cionae]|uniref:Ester hydrolase C11-like protein n=1 Tax=Cardiosporidium cionae TaxID=476202 RepID=A0ABQ7JBT1_9APIC|nr:putative Ester hydrolase C11-like protein [Cardiosporidium cionae]|eukprot:KAF8821426.1 putative Ester hydrolase C11-like protein [Cardiosporidium cionae]
MEHPINSPQQTCYSVEKTVLKNAPSAIAIADVLRSALPFYYHKTEIAVLQCPGHVNAPVLLFADLTAAPYNLAFSHLGKSAAILDVGGISNLFPEPQQDKIYCLTDLASLCQFSTAKDYYFLGAGAGPFHSVGTNSEWICNAKLLARQISSVPSIQSSSSCAVVNADKTVISLQSMPSDDFALLGNLLACEGSSKKDASTVIYIHVSNRIGKDAGGHDFPTLLASILRKHEDALSMQEPIALGGVFVQRTGRVQIHVMPAFSDFPIQSHTSVQEWLHFAEVSAPMTFPFVAVSSDPGLDLRTVHAHGFHDKEYGGHYHCDTTASEVDYEAIVTVAQSIFRIDRVPQTLDFFERKCS